MSNNKGRSTPRVVCCAIPISRSTNQVLVITSRKRSNQWVCEYPLPRRPSPVPLPHPFLSSTRASTRPLTDVSHEPHDTHDARLRSTQRRVGAIGRGARSSSLAGSLGRRSHPLSIRLPSPFLTISLSPHRVPLPFPLRDAALLLASRSRDRVLFPPPASPCRLARAHRPPPPAPHPPPYPPSCSGRARQNHALRDDNTVRVLDVPLLRAGRRGPGRGVAGEQGAQAGVGRLRRGRPEALVEA